VLLPLILAPLALGIGWSIARRDASSPLVLLVLPLALLFLLTAVPTAAYATVTTFQAIAATGNSSREMAMSAVRSMTLRLVTGGVGALLTLVVAFAIDRRRGAVPVDVGEISASALRAPAWIGWMFLTPVLVMVPAGILFWYVGELPAMIAQVAAATLPPATVAGEDLDYWSRRISARLVVGVGGGILLSLLVAILAAFNGVAAGRARMPAGAARVARWLVALAAVALAGYLYALIRTL
jgi:hypothetical protein